MKTVRLEGNIVREIIPSYGLPVQQWYGADFAAQCMEAPDEVQQGMVYSGGSFAWPVPPDPEPDKLALVEARLDYLAMMTEVELDV